MRKSSSKEIGLGLAALGRPGYINLGHDQDVGHDKSAAKMEEQAHLVLNAAWDAGIRYFDVARSYGKAEEFLASWLEKRSIAKDEVYIASKWGYQYTANWQVEAKAHEIKEHSLDQLAKQYAESREILGDYLQLYQIHSATMESGVLENASVVNKLFELKTEGLAIGLTLSGPTQAETLEKAMRIEQGGELLFDAVQATWNVLEGSAGPTLEIAHNAGMMVIVKEALANGRLTISNRETEIGDKFAGLRNIAKNYGTGIDTIAIAAVLAQAWADIVLSGATQVDHLKSNVLASKTSLKQQDLNDLQEMQEEAEAYWHKRSQLAWN